MANVSAIVEQSIARVEETVHATHLEIVSLQLFPLLQKTVELTFGAKLGAGEFSLESPLRVYNTIRRSDSTMFRLFDEMMDSCAERVFGSNLRDFEGCLPPGWHNDEAEYRTLRSTQLTLRLPNGGRGGEWLCCK